MNPMIDDSFNATPCLPTWLRTLTVGDGKWLAALDEATDAFAKTLVPFINTPANRYYVSDQIQRFVDQWCSENSLAGRVVYRTPVGP